MLTWLMLGAVRRLERRYDYDASYLRALAAASPRALIAFSGVGRLQGFLEGAPPAAIAAAALAGTLNEDCGPCTQIVVRRAEERGVSPAVLAAILAGDGEAMGPDAGLAFGFARASLARDLESSEDLREEIVSRWGQKGLAAIALALAAARVYPTVKYALGYGKTCSKVTVGGRAVAVRT
ncbi:hypothetical protein ASD38_08105 [Caulobacter sp. Root487D2Y]|uniref:hypothetical protein n=1 Tax=Caulobacter sp. Root487D2Y TaxID=1736547 RepID=UPI0006F469AA|nr:hypothetical protein [Caulobacter sp. Root487D2Y]KQY29309.1 hypothetical protein ASD38_08105 [Caulobacter sp. Root487D2Y]